MTIQVKDGTGVLVTLPTPNSNGQSTASGSAPVVLASDQSPIPVAGIPTTTGAKTGALSVSVVQATDNYRLTVSASVFRLLAAAGTTNGNNIKATAGYVDKIIGYTARATPVFLKLYNKASAPTVGTDTPVATFYLPATASFVLPVEFLFSLGISFAMTTVAADNDTTALTASDVVAFNVFYS